MTHQSKNRTKATAKQALPSAKEQTETLGRDHRQRRQGVERPKGIAPQSEDSGPSPHQVVKLALELHWDRCGVVRRLDGTPPQPPQRFSLSQFFDWAKPQTALAQQLPSGSEGGPFGYRLHRPWKAWA